MRLLFSVVFHLRDIAKNSSSSLKAPSHKEIEESAEEPEVEENKTSNNDTSKTNASVLNMKK